MSRDLGHSDGYIHHIAAGRSLPSMQEFLYICEYLGVTPSDFFDDGTAYPILTRQIEDEARGMREEDLRLVLQLMRRIKSGAAHEGR